MFVSRRQFDPLGNFDSSEENFHFMKNTSNKPIACNVRIIISLKLKLNLSPGDILIFYGYTDITKIIFAFFKLYYTFFITQFNLYF